jgi:hypothetical protein
MKIITMAITTGQSLTHMNRPDALTLEITRA